MKYTSRHFQVTLDIIIYFLNMWSWILTYLLIYSYECISLSWDLGNLFSSTQVRSYSTDQILFFLSFIYHIDEVIAIQSNRKIIGLKDFHDYLTQNETSFILHKKVQIHNIYRYIKNIFHTKYSLIWFQIIIIYWCTLLRLFESSFLKMV